MSLYERIESSPPDTAQLAGQFLAWLDDRLVQDDVDDNLAALLPDPELRLAVIATVCRSIRQP